VTARAPDPAHPFVLVDDLDEPALRPADHHHMERVRRLRPGAVVTVGDGAGRFRSVRFGPRLEVTGPIVDAARPEPPVSIGFALTKAGKPELVVEKLTELAVDEIVAFVAERSVTRWEADKAARNVERWRRIARAACEQAHRPHVPTVIGILTFAQAADGDADLAQQGGGDGAGWPRPGRRVLVGPEGGWSPAELAAVPGRVRLGPHVLRAETAAVAAGALAVASRTG
jgi:16S rRNA (uracil1498-N3)-methyltransferase